MPFHYGQLLVRAWVSDFFFFLSIAKPTQTIDQVPYNYHQLILVQPGHDPLQIKEKGINQSFNLA